MKIKKNIAVSASGLIFNPDTGESFTVNPMGAEIIGFLKDGTAEDIILGKLSEKYLVDKNTLEKDFEDFRGLLRTFALIEND